MSESAELLGDNIKKALDSGKEKMLEKDKDFVMLVTGSEGDGKSSLALLMADYWDDKFNVEEQVCMDHEQLIRTADKLEQGQAIVFDEGIEALLSRKHASKPNQIMLEWFREVRAKNLFIVICMPEWKEIDKPIRDDRAHALVKIVKQGWCHFFNKRKMNEIKVDSRGNQKTVDYPDYLFRSGWKDPAGTELWSSYQGMKRENVSNLAEKYLDDEKDKREKKWEKKYRRQRQRIVKTFIEHLGMNQKQAAETADIDPTSITKWKKRYDFGNVPPYDVGDFVKE